MRLIFLTLLLANLAMLLFSVQSQEQVVEGAGKERVQEGDALELLLLEEIFVGHAGEEAKDNEGALSNPVVDEGMGSLGGACFLVGPIDEIKSISDIVRRAIDAGAMSREITQVIPMAPMYWVYVGPFADQTNALKELKVLHGQRIDAYLIARGELKNALSLGVFENLDMAEASMEKRKSLNPKLTERPRFKKVRWQLLIWGDDSAEKYSEDKLLKEFALSDGEIRKISCKSVASG
ncbi:MAG: SPOR domain-containing protein [Hahellaceae bacterium]|nr:SPOR domain-containing protein [Hahellaceae bacterium]MCP5168530.1 SPOR domain-containing protein [Hahellaceae bacterium]